jgi:quercetin dioxygenase-like cupin family protein
VTLPADAVTVIGPARIVSRAALPYEVISDLNGNPSDEGWVHRLADTGALGDPGCEFAIGIYRMDQGMRHPLHRHAAAEFYYVLAGTALFTVHDEVIERGAGTAMYIPAGVQHAIEGPGAHGMELLYAFSVADLTKIGTEWLEQR